MEIKSRADLEAYLASMAKDPNFRKELKDNPRETIEKITGQKLPKECNFRIIEDHGLDFTLVLPQEVKEVEATLAGVSGGATTIEYGLIAANLALILGVKSGLGGVKFP